MSPEPQDPAPRDPEPFEAEPFDVEPFGAEPFGPELFGPEPLERGRPSTETAEPRRPAVPAAVRRRSRSAVARSAAGDRGLLVLLGTVLAAVGVLVALVAAGVFGAGRAERPLLDPVVVDALRAQPLLWRVVAIAGGVALALLGLAWAARSVRPETRPDLRLESTPGTSIVIGAAAAADAVATTAAGLPGVGRARARLVGSEAAPALRVTLWLADDADVRAVLHGLHDDVLATVRSALGLTALPVAVRLELDRPQRHPRVA